MPFSNYVPTQVNGQSVLGGSFVFTSTSFIDTGLFVSLPSAGTYLINANVRMIMTTVATSFLECQLYDGTNGAAIPNSTGIMLDGGSTTNFQIMTTMNKLVTITGPITLKLYVRRGGGTFTSSSIESDAEGYTTLNFIKQS